MDAPLSSWPWGNLGHYKYALYGPIIAKVLHTRINEGSFKDDWCLHILVIWTLRVIIYSLWSSFSNMLLLIRNYRIDRTSYDFKQIDKEWDWDNLLLLQTLIAAMACSVYQPFIENVPLWNWKAFIVCLFLHVGISEPLYYWVHKYFHTSHCLFSNYHSLHHSSPVLHPYTGANATFLEQLILTTIIGIPIIGCFVMGFGSKTMVYGYIVVFDFLTCFGHCNVEFISYRLFKKFPLLKYILYTPSYQTLHHKEMDSNYCLFMPLFDVIWGTLNLNSWEFHKTNCYRAGKEEKTPDFVFLAHVVDIMNSLHVGFITRPAASLPFATFTMTMCALPAWPFAFIGMLIVWSKAKHFLVFSFNLRDKLLETWVVPRYGFHYFLPFAKDGINKLIEDAILAADRIGVKVINLAALNKNEALNGGGTLFVEKHPELKVRVVHGNTLTAAIILNEIPKDVKQVFVSGATSKLGRAIALYLCQKRVRVLMLTSSVERFRKIQSEAPKEFQDYLVHVTNCEAAQDCMTWIVGKWITPWEQSWAPKGTHFHQFVIPPIIQFRRDCTYWDLSAMKLPDHLVQGLGSCWHTVDRGVVHACHAGGIVHVLEGWSHHEVGAIEVDKIDLVWNAALKHGFKAVTNHLPLQSN